jgi:hypothetical protein
LEQQILVSQERGEERQFARYQARLGEEFRVLLPRGLGGAELEE